MKNVRSYRAMGSLCRQRAVFDPANSSEHLGQAERWEQLAEADFEECNAAVSKAQFVPAQRQAQAG
jgi:hypothetical protein